MRGPSPGRRGAEVAHRGEGSHSQQRQQADRGTARQKQREQQDEDTDKGPLLSPPLRPNQPNDDRDPQLDMVGAPPLRADGSAQPATPSPQRSRPPSPVGHRSVPSTQRGGSTPPASGGRPRSARSGGALTPSLSASSLGTPPGRSLAPRSSLRSAGGRWEPAEVSIPVQSAPQPPRGVGGVTTPPRRSPGAGCSSRGDSPVSITRSVLSRRSPDPQRRPPTPFASPMPPSPAKAGSAGRLAPHGARRAPELPAAEGTPGRVSPSRARTPSKIPPAS